MKALKFWLPTLSLAAVVMMPAWTSVAAEDRVVFGELVVLKGSTNKFRIVEHPGSFTAPAGTPLESLDGKAVEVQLGSGNRVVSITERPIAINPVESGWETIRGQVQVRDPLARSFSFAGGDRVYTAPANIEIGPYAGRYAEVRLDPSGRVTELKLIPEPQGYVPAAPAPVVLAPAPGVVTPLCNFGGLNYSDGVTVCQSGTQFRCEHNAWRNLGTACTELAPPPERTCMFGDATVASGSSICRQGTTFRCADGTWVSTQLACR
jgi:hypothetical protein